MKTLNKIPRHTFAGMSLKAHRPNGVDLGVLQSEFEGATRALKSAATKLANAQEAFATAKTRQQQATDKLKTASLAVLTN